MRSELRYFCAGWIEAIFCVAAIAQSFSRNCSQPVPSTIESHRLLLHDDGFHEVINSLLLLGNILEERN